MSTFNPFGKFFKPTVPLQIVEQPAAEKVVTTDSASPLAAIAFTQNSLALSGLSAGVARSVIDVGDKPAAPTIVRGGEEVVAPPLNVNKVTDLIGRLQPILRVQVPRGVSQSIQPGTMVAKGTPIDVVFVPVSDIDFSLFDNVHDDLKAKSVEDILPVIQDPSIAPILQKATVDDLSEAEKSTLTSKLATLGVEVVDSVPTKSLAIAFSSLKSAKAFQ